MARLTPSLSISRAAKKGLVEVASGLVGLSGIQPGAVFQQAERDLQAFLDDGVVGAGQLKPFGLALLDGQGFPAVLEISHRQCLGEVGVDQFLALSLELLQASALVGEQLLVCRPLLGHFL
jgi:hypothetical protein